MSTRHHGFTLIELMIVVAIISILSAIALPLIRSHQARAAENACLAEMKMYVNTVTASLATQDLPGVPLTRACATSDAATMNSTAISGSPKPPGIRSTTCDVATASCVLSP